MRKVLLLLCLIVGCLASDYYPPPQTTKGVPDRVEVVSSALRVLPRRQRVKRAPSWRKTRDYEFVTRTSSRSPRRLPYQDEESNYPPPAQDYFERRRDFPNRRVIYYATLPEVVRRPGEWTPPRPIYPGYPSIRDNEVVTRVQSGLIDVSPNNYNQDLPRFTIIDAEPPYNRPPPPPRNYDRFDDYRRYDYNRFDYRNQVDPYRSSYYEPPYRHENLPAQPVTVIRQPVEIRPLDVRPLHPLSTQAPPLSSSTTESTTTVSSASQEVASYERSFKS